MKTDSPTNTPTNPNWIAELWAVESAKFKKLAREIGNRCDPDPGIWTADHASVDHNIVRADAKDGLLVSASRHLMNVPIQRLARPTTYPEMALQMNWGV